MRESRMDNVRFLLIFFVALGHFFEVTKSPMLIKGLEFIYSFHMPVFVFVSGYFAKYNTKRIARTYLYSYLTMQLAYVFFDRFCLERPWHSLQLSTPNYTLWYLLAMALYCMLIPFIQTESFVKKIIAVILAFAVSLMAGAETAIGYAFGLGRFFGFLPFFILGFYCRAANIQEKLNKIKLPVKILSGVFLAGIVAAVELYIIDNKLIEFRDMTFSYSYDQTKLGWPSRAAILAAGLLWIVFLLIVVPNKKIPMVSNIGANTFPIYLFHGFVVKILVHNELTSLNARPYAVIAVAISAVMLLLFGNKLASFVAKWVFTAQWLDALESKLNKRKRLS